LHLALSTELFVIAEEWSLEHLALPILQRHLNVISQYDRLIKCDAQYR